MSDFNKLDANRIVTDIAIKDGRIMDAVNLAKRGVQLVLAAATHRQQVLEAERRDEIYGTFTTQVCSPFTPISGEEVGRVP